MQLYFSRDKYGGFYICNFEHSRIHTVDFMKDEIEIKDYLMLRSFVVSAAIIGGALSAMILDYLGVKLTTMLSIIALLGVFAIFIEYRLYGKCKTIHKDEYNTSEALKISIHNKITL